MDSYSLNKETNSSPERSNSASSKRLKSCSVEDLSKEDLICRVKQLEAHVTQLKNIIAKSESKKTAEWKSKRPFDFTRYSTRHIALKLLYLGWDYHGFAVQEDSDRTIEAALFDALTKAKLVQNRESSNYHRCGRTDKGVSAFSQVISIDVRSNLTEGVGVKVGEDGSTNQNKSNSKEEIRYVRVLNKLLPPEIRILAWAPVPADFSARFDCQQRTYKYFFPRGNLKIDLMLEAGHKLLGEHDYRNFCKMDVAHGVVNFVRNISSLTITEDSQSEGSEYNMCELTVTGKAFLWHQIRCVVAILFLVGKGKESPQIVDELLDVERYPSRPQYTMAADLPLVLFDCDFENLEWIYDEETHGYNIRDLKHIWGRSAIKAAMTRRMLKELDTVTAPPDDNSVGPRGDNFLDWLSPSWHGKTYRPLLARQTCDSLEDKMESAAKKRKFNEASKNSGDG